MLTLKRNCLEISSISFNGEPLEDSLGKEWLLTNNRGGYCSSTITGCNTSRYHGLLVGSLNPPASRIMALSQCLETLIVEQNDSNKSSSERTYHLSAFEFEDKIAPVNGNYIKKFHRDIGVHYDYEVPDIRLTKSIYLLPDDDIVVLEYNFTRVKRNASFILRPFIGLRDFHSLQKSYAPLMSICLLNGLLVRHDVPGSCQLFINAPKMEFKEDKQWWFEFLYRNDKQRGQHYTEDLWSPGFFQCEIDSPTRVVFQAGLYGPGKIDLEPFRASCNIKNIHESLISRQNDITSCAKSSDKNIRNLSLAADKFVVKKNSDNGFRTKILAGFPWFADWGRDTFISVPGLLLATGREEDANSVLASYAQAADEGMVPNRFDDHSKTAYFNSVDASLWFIHAAFQYFYHSQNMESFTRDMLPVIRWIVDSYQKGTRFNIQTDEDGLISAGDENTQLTWMDAKCNGVVFTPRYGKAVEINALWFNALSMLADFYEDRDSKIAVKYKEVADKVGESFVKVFWNETLGYLNDCILPDGSVDSALRPNQIFAVSLPYSALNKQRQKSIVDIVKKKLLTPYGLRTLDTEDNQYKGRYVGSQEERDQAYHQGTVWPYLIGPFVESYLKVNDFSRHSRKEASEFIKPLLKYLTSEGCLGNIPEIFDGDEPFEGRGCMAQAWSIAELIRAYQLIHS
ncbi:MAG: amylo-alpha-1,6-glucosidase [Planctomycetota bacterium]